MSEWDTNPLKKALRNFYALHALALGDREGAQQEMGSDRAWSAIQGMTEEEIANAAGIDRRFFGAYRDRQAAVLKRQDRNWMRANPELARMIQDVYNGIRKP